MKYYYDIEQGSDEWHLLRCGRFTASGISNLFMGKSTAGYNNYINSVVYGRLFNETSEDSFSNEWTIRGLELEPEAINHYELETFNKINRVGFVELNSWVGCSPDGLLGEDGLIQIKCPKYSTQIDYHLKGQIPKNYYYQIQGEIYITGREWNIFYSYHPKLKPFVKKVKRDDKLISEIETKLNESIQIVKDRIELIK